GRLADGGIGIAIAKFSSAKIKGRWNDADDGVSGAVQRDGSTQNGGLSAVSAPPETFAKKSHRRAAEMIVATVEGAADEGSDSKRLEELRGDQIARYMFSPGTREYEIRAAIGGEGDERAVLTLPLEKIEVAER